MPDSLESGSDEGTEGKEVCLQYRELRNVECAEPHAQAPQGALVQISEEADHE